MIRWRGRGLVARVVSAFLAVAIGLGGGTADASPTIWGRARVRLQGPSEDDLRSAERALFRYRKTESAEQRWARPSTLELRDARKTLEKAGAAASNDPAVRMLYAEILNELGAQDEALAVFKSLVERRAPAPFLADAFSEIAVIHAKKGERTPEIQAYTEALRYEPHVLSRSRLLANRAEAYMAEGELGLAIVGYRQALSILGTVELMFYGSTSLWGLGVAQDRYGDTSAAFEAIRLARAYDPHDARLTSQSWFFSPPYDEHYYFGLGAWAAAVSARTNAGRAEAYLQAAERFERYLAEAPADDRYRVIAEARLAAVQREAERERLRRIEEERKQRAAERAGSKKARSDDPRDLLRVE